MATAFQADAFQADPLAFQIETALAARLGPADDRKRRRPVIYLRADDDDRKRRDALEDAEAAIDRAKAAETAAKRRQAVKQVFAALERSAKDEAERAALAAQAQALERAKVALVWQALAEIQASIDRELALRKMRRDEEEEFLLRMWAG
jgi:DNA primase catalytic subunit